jgi:hypothetical protein
MKRRRGDEDWLFMGQAQADGTGRISYEDSQVLPGVRYGYRLGVSENGHETLVGETWVDVPVRPEFLLAGPRPNPAQRGFTVAFSLPDAAAARIELFDVSGRRRLARDVGGLGAGNHVLDLAESRDLAPGVYLLRLIHGRESLSVRAAIVR